MNKRACFAIVLGCLVVMPLAGQGSQAGLPTVDQILAKNIEAIGGRAAIEKVTSITARGTISVPDAGVDGTIQLYQKAPDKALTIVDIGGMQQREGMDGAIAWSDDPQNGFRQKSGAELAEARRGAVFARELKMKELYPKITVKGREKVGASEAYVVELVPAEGAPAVMYYDVTSGLVVRQLITRQSPMGPIEVDVALEDYRAVDGVKRPFRIRQATSQFTAVVQLTEVTHNAPIDDAMFKAK
jgi:hypothetical protein